MLGKITKPTSVEKLLKKSFGEKKFYRITDFIRFNEIFYLEYHSDVAEAVKNGTFRSGWQHYLRCGFKEGRATHYDEARLLWRKIGNLMEPISVSRWRFLGTKLKPVQGRSSTNRTPVTNVFIPTIDPDIFFGGYIAFFHFLSRLVEAGTKLRFVVLEDHCNPGWFLKGISNRQRWVKAFENAEFVNLAAKNSQLDVHSDDAVIVYSAWMALAAKEIIPLIKARKFIFFVQEYESVFHEYDSLAFLVNSAYRLPHTPIFNSRALHDYFKKHRIGIFAHTDERQLSFEHNTGALDRKRWPRTFGKRLLFYGRPERHAGRNLCDIGILTLRAAAAKGIIDDTWEVFGIGSLIHKHRVPLDDTGRLFLNIVPRVPEEEYEAFINGFDVGLSLMSAPHPGVVHFEWALRGIVTVVNCTHERDQAFFNSYDLPIVPAEPDIDGIVRALARAIQMAKEGYQPRGDATRSFGCSWDEVFSRQFIANIISTCDIPICAQSVLLDQTV